MITAVQAVKRMRGKSRAVHMLANNGWHYVVKPPMIGHRAMINEWLGARLSHMIGLLAADVHPISIPPALAQECWPDAPPEGIVGVASAYPLDPTQHPIFDFLPLSLSDTVGNLDHLVGALALDVWTGKSEPRHCVFYRQGLWWAFFVDHKGVLGGSRWDCNGMDDPRNPAQGRWYEAVLHDEQIDLWVDQIAAIRPESLSRVFQEVPEQLIGPSASRADLSQLADLLLSRRDSVPAMLRCMAGASPLMVPRDCGKMALNASCPST